MSIRRFLIASIAPTYSLLVAWLILILTSSPYEAFIGEVSDGNVTTICDLPTESDDPTAEYAVFTGILVMGLLAVGAVRSWRARRIRPSLVCGVLLLLMWAYYFFLQKVGC